MSLPAGTVTFLFTDIEGATRLLRELGDQQYVLLLNEERSLLREIVQKHAGYEVDNQGDSFFFAFASARDALSAAVMAQRVVAAHAWPQELTVRVRMGVHTGEALRVYEGYVGRDVHRAARISTVAHGGQIVISEATQILTHNALPVGISLRDLGEHRLKDLGQPERLFQVVVRELPDRFPALRSLNTLPNNLPFQLTRFVGRRHEIEELKDLLSATRLVTLTGPGGSGKTRLALQLAAEVSSQYRDGVWFVDLAPLSDMRLLPHTVARTFGLNEESVKDPGRALIDFLQEKSILLLLDNCEHVVDACAQLVEATLVRCKDARIVSTSREPLKVGGELTYKVPPLSIPNMSRLTPVEIAQSEAVQLFIDRANLVRPRVPVSDSDLGSIAGVCTKLDGLPLAIELAASRVRLMSVEEINAKLVDRFRLLTDGHRAGLPRHHTLHAAIDWSYELLTPQESILLCRLSVFSGGFSLEAAEQVCGTQPLVRNNVFDLLTSLVDKSLVDRGEQRGVTRFRLLETVKQYAQTKADPNDALVMLDRHLNWCLDLAEQAEAGREGPDQRLWLDRLEENIGNLRLGLRTSLEAENEEVGLRLVGSLGWFWGLRVSTAEGLRWSERVIARRKQNSLASAKALSWAARYTALFERDYERARELAEEGLNVARRVGDRRHEGFCLNTLGLVAQERDDYDQATHLSTEGLEVFRITGDRWGMIHALQSLADIALDQGDHSKAADFAEQSLTLSRQLGNKNLASGALMLLGVIALHEADHNKAIACFTESLALRREIGTRSHIVGGLINLAIVARLRGDYAEATKFGEEALALAREWGNKRRILAALSELAGIFRDQGEFAKVTQLCEERVSLAKEISDEWALIEVNFDLGFVAYFGGNHDRARTLLEKVLDAARKRKGGAGTAYKIRALSLLAKLGGTEHGTVLAHEALRISLDSNRKFNSVTALDVLASLAHAGGDPHRATRLYAAAETLRKKWQFPLRPVQRAEFREAVARLQAELGQDSFEEAWLDGAAMTLESAATVAMRPEEVNKP